MKSEVLQVEILMADGTEGPITSRVIFDEMINTFSLCIELLFRAAIVAVRDLVDITVVPTSPVNLPQAFFLQSGLIIPSRFTPITSRAPIHYFRVVNLRIGVLLNFLNRTGQRFLRRIDVIFGVP